MYGVAMYRPCSDTVLNHTKLTANSVTKINILVWDFITVVKMQRGMWYVCVCVGVCVCAVFFNILLGYPFLPQPHVHAVALEISAHWP